MPKPRTQSRIDKQRLEGATTSKERCRIYIEEATVWLTALIVELEKMDKQASAGIIRRMTQTLRAVYEKLGGLKH